MDSHPDELPADIDTLKAALATARAKASDDQALIAHQKLQIEKLRRELYQNKAVIYDLLFKASAETLLTIA